jgi:hypothetical protein
LLEIKRHLIHSDFNIKEIAHMVGFSDPTNCNKFFKKYTNQSQLNSEQQIINMFFTLYNMMEEIKNLGIGSNEDTKLSWSPPVFKNPQECDNQLVQDKTHV